MKKSPAVKLTRQRQKEFSAKTQFKDLTRDRLFSVFPHGTDHSG